MWGVGLEGGQACNKRLGTALTCSLAAHAHLLGRRLPCGSFHKGAGCIGYTQRNIIYFVRWGERGMAQLQWFAASGIARYVELSRNPATWTPGGRPAGVGDEGGGQHRTPSTGILSLRVLQLSHKLHQGAVST